MSDDPDFGELEPVNEFERTFDPEAETERQKAERETERLARQRKELLAALLANPEIRDWLWELISEFDAFRKRFGITPSGFPDSLGTAYRDGWRDAGWYLWTQLDDADPDLASLMRREHKG